MEQPIMNMAQQIKAELEGDILPFWMNHMIDSEQGGFYGYATNDLRIQKKALKGCILNSRILWTYSTAYRIYGLEEYKNTADHAFQFLKKAFWDHQNSGLYWMANYRGKPTDTRKQIYNIAFGIYGLSEYYRALKVDESLDMAVSLYKTIEKHSFDAIYGGYREAFTGQWEKISDMRLSPKDLNAEKTMNTHLHILEAYTNLLRVWTDEGLREKLQALVCLIRDKIIHPETKHFKLFFDKNWNSLSETVSFGHDIEGSWLLCEAAEVLADPELIKEIREIALKMADSVLEEGYDTSFGGIYNEAISQVCIDFRKDWWPQAETIVGLMNAWQLTGKKEYLDSMLKTWNFIDKNVIDHQHGEWFSSVSRHGKPDESLPKVEPWKCPYHNSRACFEFLSRQPG